MRRTGDWLRRSIAGCLVALLAVPLAQASGRPPGGQPPNPILSQSQDPQSQSAPAPAAPAQAPQNSTPSSGEAPATPQAAPPEPQTTSPAQAGSSAPVGTAAAPYEKGIGIAASRPAGAAIAPGKQKRSRSLLIKVGILLGAAAAVGTVVALSSASPSKP